MYVYVADSTDIRRLTDEWYWGGKLQGCAFMAVWRIVGSRHLCPCVLNHRDDCLSRPNSWMLWFHSPAKAGLSVPFEIFSEQTCHLPRDVVLLTRLGPKTVSSRPLTIPPTLVPSDILLLC